MRPRITAILLPLSVLVAFSVLGVMRGSFSSVFGDEGTYLAMAQSVSRDGDLMFDTADRERLERAAGAGRQTVILQQTGKGISYSKPILYPLLVAPFHRLLGDLGLVLFNALAMGAALALAWGVLRRQASSEEAWLTLWTFFGAGVLPAYLVWKMPDLFQVALATAGLSLALATVRGAPLTTPDLIDRLLANRWAPVVGGGLLGLLAALRYPNLLIALAPIAALAISRRRHSMVLVAAGCLAAFVLVALCGWVLVGTINPYKETRASFNAETGYPLSAEDPGVMEQFEARRATQSVTFRPELQPDVSAYSTGYFFVGRHTGLIFYFPAALVLVLAALRRPDRVGLTLVAGAAAVALFYLIWMPRNYFGGATFIGNRYFLAAYPLLLFASGRPLRGRSLIATWSLGILVVVSSIVSVAETRERDPGSQSHAYAGLFRLLPYESTALRIEGWRDRYWSGDLLRFVDPFAQVTEEAFVLRAGDRPAEILLASRRQGPLMRLEVRANTDEAVLEVTDRRGQRTYPLPRDGTVAVETAPSWRHHRFWWDADRTYSSRTLRLAVSTPDGEPATVRFSYSGLRPAP
ncbi:MAG: hypothetical protein WBG64_05945 [Thermoanaerobaculia bacterium]